jgi:hypothetical protein
MLILLESLNRVVVGNGADVSEVYAVSISTVNSVGVIIDGVWIGGRSY